MGLVSRRARLYESVRTAHLERARELRPAAIVYRVRRYDFDESLTEGLEVVQASPVRAAMLLRRSRLDALEINEPLMTSSVGASALAVFAVRFLRGRSRPRIVTYAIGNADPFASSPASLKGRVRRAGQRVLARYVSSRVDAIAYGTEGARSVYSERLPSVVGRRETVIPALPARTAPTGRGRGQRVIFLGAFVARKGLPLLMEAWPTVKAARPGATLTLVGKGVLLADAMQLAASDDAVDVVVDPPRSEIRDSLAGSLVLVLPSQPSPTWREQVGLPIVEALEAGCSIVTTTETGLASWLADHGHGVIPAFADASVLAAAIIGQIDAGDRSARILESLPPEDGRLAADRWLFGDEDAGIEGGGSRE